MNTIRTRRGPDYIPSSPIKLYANGDENCDDQCSISDDDSSMDGPGIKRENTITNDLSGLLMSPSTSGLNTSIPVTQPLESTEEECKENPVAVHVPRSDQPWAYLSTVSKYFESAEIREDKFTCGRMDTCNYVLRTPKIPEEFIVNLSRNHFSIFKIVDREDEHPVYAELMDLSTTGTFINGEKVGKNQKRPLVNGDVISLRTDNAKAFKFQLIDNFEEQDGSRERRKNLPKVLELNYVIGPEIGTGAGGTVYLGYPKSRDATEKVAIKVIWKVTNKTEGEVEILRKVNHPCIIKIVDVIHAENCMVIILSYAKGGELFNIVIEDFEKNMRCERIAKLQMYQILDAVRYLHEIGVVHRDLKLENILLTKKSRTALLKIVDFGLSKDMNTRLASFVGTMTYMAPEILQGRNGRKSYTEKADLWSLGCILYSLLSGTQAFNGGTNFELETAILNADVDFSKKYWRGVSIEAMDLVKRLLAKDSSRRISAKDALKHQWFTKDPSIVEMAKRLMNGGQVDESEIRGGSGRRPKRKSDDEVSEAASKMLKIDERNC